jgi:hypothetical protein
MDSNAAIRTTCSPNLARLEEPRPCESAASPPSPRSVWNSRVIGGVGAAAGVLWPKCPMCWMLITGSVLTGGVMKLCVEMVGVVLFAFSFGKLLQYRRAALIAALTAVLGTIASMDVGIWTASTLHIAMLVCGMIVMMLLQLRQHCCKFGRVCRGRKSFLEGEECNLEHANTGEDCRNFQCWFGH